MGSDDGEPNERPVHNVYLDAFYIDALEVTTSRYAKFLTPARETPFRWSHVIPRADGDRPVIGVSWDDALAYCQSFGRQLPTEAQWEKAARGSDQRKYPWGNAEPESDHGLIGQCCAWHGYATLANAGSFKRGASPFGAQDMGTNVAEWTADWYSPTYYEVSKRANPQGPTVSGNPNPYSLDLSRKKVVRGGSWTSGANAARTTFRAFSAPTNRHGNVGFRCATSAGK